MSRAFGAVREDESALTAYALEHARIRPGFPEFAAACDRLGLRLAIVSNGLEFYIRALLGRLGLSGLEIHSAAVRFDPRGLRLVYRGPGRRHRRGRLKVEYLDSFRRRFRRIIYIGNGGSDAAPARLADEVFATGELPAACLSEGLACTPFKTFHEVIDALI